MFAAICTVLMLLADPASQGDLRGVVVGPDNQPVILANVMVYCAVPKKGPQLREQLDYPDCGKSALSYELGAFTIPNVDPTLSYELLVLADGFRPTALRKVDPARGEIRAKLLVLPKDVEADHLAKGRVVDGDGKPVVGAWIQTHGYRDGQQRMWGGGEVVEKETWTDARGEFTLVCTKTDLIVFVEVHDRTVAPIVYAINEGGDPCEINTTAGAVLTGRLVKDGQPVPGVRLQLAQVDRSFERWVGEFTAFTDDNGRFTFRHAAPNDTYNLWTVMKSLGEKACMPVQQIGVTVDGTTVDAGDVSIEPGFTVAGQLVCSDDKPVPAGTTITLSRAEVRDPIEAKVDADGKFEFKCIAGEAYSFNVATSGYTLSTQNQSYAGMKDDLEGLIDQDMTDLRVQLDPTQRVRNVTFSSNQLQTLLRTRLAGVAAP